VVVTVQKQDAPALEARHMRKVLGHIPTSVAIVCTMDGRQPVGCTIGSFVSASLDPPLVAFFAMRSSSTLGAILRAGTFSVNVLAADQAQICDVFARKLPDRFRHLSWTAGQTGSPLLHGTLTALDCDLESVATVGDHEMIVGRVLTLTNARPGAEPLVFARGALRGLPPTQDSGRHPYAWLDE
jgi:3-hydroxy-9,10-secoandrosta-1,3,5(10)-triene-9,17-dione monooxygenase reductase component